MGRVEFVTVNVQVGSNTYKVKMQKGTSFSNNSGVFTADQDGATVKMTNYQLQIFKAIANNTAEDGQSGIVLSEADIKAAQEKFRNGGFVEDLKELLPDGYKIEKPKMSTNDRYVEAYITDGQNSHATMRFSYGNSVNETAQSNPPKNNQNNNNRKIPTTVNEECLRILDPDGNGKFEYDPESYPSNLPVDVNFYGFYDEGKANKYFNKVHALDGQPITPQLIDQLVNIILDAEKEAGGILTYEGDWSYSTDSPMRDVARFSAYLKPQTIDKLLNTYTVPLNQSIEYAADNVRCIKNLYDILTPQQREAYYTNLLTPNYNIHYGQLNNSQYPGETTANLIFESPLSTSTFKKLKDFVIEMNSPNGVAYTKTECAILIETLLDKKQITQQQADELFRAGKISQD